VPLPAFAAWALTLSFVVLLFVLFRAPDLATANNIYLGLLGEGGTGAMWALKTSWPILIGGAPALIKTPSFELGMRLQPNWRTAAAFVVIAVFCVLEVGKGAPQSFIYFQF